MIEADSWTLAAGRTEWLLLVLQSGKVLDEVQDSFGYALHLAQTGAKHAHAKPLKGFGSAGVLHCFQKKSTSGIATPKPDLDLIRDRLKAALAHAGQVAP